MKRFSRHGIYNPMADINIVPLMDLVFNLLIVFMMATPLLEHSVEIQLPQTKSGAPANTSKLTVINLDRAGRIFVEENQTSTEALKALIVSRLTVDPDHGVVIRGDQTVSYGSFMQIVDILKECGVKRLSMAGLTIQK